MEGVDSKIKGYLGQRLAILGFLDLRPLERRCWFGWKVRLLGRKTVVRRSDLLSQGLLMYRKAGIRIYDVNPLTDCRNRVSDGRPGVSAC